MKCKNCKGKVSGKIPYFKCDDCGTKYTLTEIYSRVVGYIRPICQWNDAKQAEFLDRKLFTPESQTKF